MRRYVSVAKPRSEWWDDAVASECLARTVYEPDSAPIDTGLLDASGNSVFAVEEMEPIGFVSLKSR